MTLPNHAMTGALIGLTVSNPAGAVIGAFLSHFLLDVIPHYDVPGETNETRIDSRLFQNVQIVGGGLLCGLIILALLFTRPNAWLLGSICAAVAVLPDALSAPRYFSVKRHGKDIRDNWWFWKFHDQIQWRAAPRYAWIELVWAILFGWLLSRFLV
ncbi:hypothetical protein KDA23_01900 [Candidatus Saccharibacteria bacterium]|nr:hypothetical protein [Candidatus Saccharibacteria bacterium]